MNPISTVAAAVTHPLRTAGSLTGHAVGLAAAGVRTTLRVVDRASGRGRGDEPPGWVTEPPRTDDADRAPDVVDDAGPDAPGADGPEADVEEPAPPRRPRRRKAPSARAATIAPALSPEVLAELVDEEDDGPLTPSGIPAADVAHNPDTTDTDLHQPGTPPLMDPSITKAVRSESKVLRRAADRDKG